MNNILAKTVSEHQRDWDTRLPYAMAAYRATQHDATGYSPNMLVLGRETRAPPDLVYGAPDEDTSEVTYDRYVEEMHNKAVEAFHEVRVSLQKSASRNKKYYDLGLKQQQFATGDWVLYFNPHKLRRKQMKWVRQFEGPFLVVSKPTSLTAHIQRSPKAQIRVAHIDKLKHFTGTPPKAWKLPDETTGSSEVAHHATAGSHSAGQGNIKSPPAVASDSYTDPSVVDRHIQFPTAEGCDPDVVTTSGQSAVRDATTTIGIETPTGVRSGVSSRGRKNFVKPMGVAEFARSDGGKFSAPMGAREFGEVHAAGGQHGKSAVYVAGGQHSTNEVDRATNRFASGVDRHENGAAMPSDVADRRGIETRPDCLGESSADANMVARGRLANEPSSHVGSAALPSDSKVADQGAARNLSGAGSTADLHSDSMSGSNKIAAIVLEPEARRSVVRVQEVFQM